jgi:hypothetical protein
VRDLPVHAKLTRDAWGSVLVSAWMAASSVAHAESRVIVTCIAGTCRADIAALPLQPFLLVVRGLDDRSASIPRKHTAKGDIGGFNFC